MAFSNRRSWTLDSYLPMSTERDTVVPSGSREKKKEGGQRRGRMDDEFHEVGTDLEFEYRRDRGVYGARRGWGSNHRGRRVPSTGDTDNWRQEGIPGLGRGIEGIQVYEGIRGRRGRGRRGGTSESWRSDEGRGSGTRRGTRSDDGRGVVIEFDKERMRSKRGIGDQQSTLTPLTPDPPFTSIRSPRWKGKQDYHEPESFNPEGFKPVQKGQSKPTYIHRLGIRDLKTLARNDPREVINKLENELKGFQHSLNDCFKVKGDSSREEYVEAVLQIVIKVCQARGDDQQESANIILAEFLSTRCSKFHMLLAEYVKKLPLSDSYLTKVENLCQMLRLLLSRLPTSSWSVLPVKDLSETSNFLSLSPTLTDKIAELKEQYDEIREQCLQQRKSQVEGIHRHEFENWDDSQYKQVPILPTMEEVCHSAPPCLRSNIIQGSYKGWEHYYDIQFRLLREDFIAPLRRGVQSLLAGTRGRDLHDINMYRGVYVLEPVFTRKGTCFALFFDASRFRKNWEHSKRLIYGSLLCLSPDGFQDQVYFATVYDRKSEELEKGIFLAKFEDDFEVFNHCSKMTEFVMIESRAYFEASRHILHSLQIAEIDTMPFTECLLKYHPKQSSATFRLESSIPSCVLGNPKYMKDGYALFDLRWLYPDDKSNECQSVNLLNVCGWPKADEIELDQSQLDAIKMALTQEIAVIQGPPGTGKTYIGYKIVQTLLQNRNVWDPERTSPILVMCFTNHALDQFLEGLLECNIVDEAPEDDEPVYQYLPRSSRTKSRKPNIVRVGGRSKNEKIQELNINQVRNWVPRELLDERREILTKIDDSAKRMLWKSLELTYKYPINTFIVGPEGRKRLRCVINRSHFAQLDQLAQDDEELLPHVLEIWLGMWGNVQDETVKQGDQVVTVQTKRERLSTMEDEKNDEIEVEEIEEEELIDVTGEAELELQERLLDDTLSGAIYRRNDDEEEDGFLFDDFEEESSGKQWSVQHKTNKTGEKQEKSQQNIHRKSEEEIAKILQQIRHVHPMSMGWEMIISDVNMLNEIDRRRLFRLWVHKYQMRLKTQNEKRFEEYNELCVQLKETQLQIDRYSLEKAEVIGMTTTGASKYQHIIHLVKPKIVIVEEAAELLEAHIVSALNAGTQHLILIGDHKQLRPKPNEYDLAKKHNLHISLFERLIRNGLPHATLLIQHRMRPQIARLVHPHVYDTLENHESVEKRSDIKGFDKNMFFFHHEHEEEEEDTHLLSHSNEYEADMVVALCKHLLNQGYEPSQITILTAYTGQLLKVRKRMPKRIFDGVRVVNVDNFQGEENDIIILSLVRNNKLNNVGFLREENRVCVALSRAKLGFYCFGNFKMLRDVVPLWDVILSSVEKEGCLGDILSLHCHNHRNTTFKVKDSMEFKIFSPEGGCTEKCTYRLDCGHQCTRLCHPDDPEHTSFECLKPCARRCPDGDHPCHVCCYEKCPPCKIRVKRIIPQCSHEQEMFCYEEPSTIKCQEPCPKSCSEGHPCKLLCYQRCLQCKIRVKRIVPQCSHEQEMYCYEEASSFVCKMTCLKLCPNGLHKCPLYCGEGCRRCIVIVEKIMPECGHTQIMRCYVPVDKHYCNVQVDKVIPNCGHIEQMECHTSPSSHKCCHPCEKILTCEHQCKKKCSEYCNTSSCTELVSAMLQCGHFEMVPCNEKHRLTTRYSFLFGHSKCSHPCEKIMRCGHRCKKKCGEVCSDCNEPVEATLPCGHTMTMTCKEEKAYARYSYHYTKHQCIQPCTKTLSPCGHPCPNKCSEKCPSRCEVPVMVACLKGHESRCMCYQSENPCKLECMKPLPCGHNCGKKCSEECGTCDVMVNERCPCGHIHPNKCGDKSFCSCSAKCTIRLKCGHICSGKCGQCYTNRVHYWCTQSVSLKPFCGHFGTVPCLGMQYNCPKACQVAVCPHNKEPCTHTCSQECIRTCTSECQVQCPHRKCKQQCHQPCQELICNEPCGKLLQCRHYCPGLCGEKCLTSCMICSPKKFRQKVVGLSKKARPDRHRYIQLDCGHIFTLQYLDNQFFKHTKDQLVTPLLCPTCQQLIISVKRYWHVAKKLAQEIKQIKHMSAVEDVSAADLIKEAEYILLKERFQQRREFGPRKLSTLPYTTETVCALQLLLFANDLVATDMRSEVLKLHTMITFLIIQGRAKLSEQFIFDVSSELYRIHLTVLTRKVKQCLDDSTKATLESMKGFGGIQSVLDQMESNHTLRLTEEDYKVHLHVLKDLYLERSGMELDIIVTREIIKPVITKGEWYRCTRAGHLYFISATNRKGKPGCNYCI